MRATAPSRPSATRPISQSVTASTGIDCHAATAAARLAASPNEEIATGCSRPIGVRVSGVSNRSFTGRSVESSIRVQPTSHTGPRFRNRADVSDSATATTPERVRSSRLTQGPHALRGARQRSLEYPSSTVARTDSPRDRTSSSPSGDFIMGQPTNLVVLTGTRHERANSTLAAVGRRRRQLRRGHAPRRRDHVRADRLVRPARLGGFVVRGWRRGRRRRIGSTPILPRRRSDPEPDRGGRRHARADTPQEVGALSAGCGGGGDHASGRMTSPVSSFGVKNVDFGGITTPSRAVRSISATLTGRISTAACASPPATAATTRSTPC